MKRLKIHRWLASAEYSRRDQFIAFVRNAIAEREEAEKNSKHRRDYFYWLTQAVDSETKQHYSLGEVEMECVLLWNAGTNGPSVALAGSFFYLSCYPKVLERLTSEVRSTFDTAEEIRSGSKMVSCTYLQAVLDEVIRLCPANTGVLPRQAMAQGQFVDGLFLSENTVLGVSAYAIHHNVEYFPDPFTFRPERWIVDSAPEFDAACVSRARAAFFSFSAGGSGCVGRPLAYQEVAVALARVLYRFDIRRTPADGLGAGSSSFEKGRRNPNEFQLDDVHAVLTTGPSIQFRKRS
jgi:cytochrome P450